MKSRIEWFKHLFWLIGWSFWCLIQLDFYDFLDTLFWMRIHLTCKSNFIGKIKVGLKQEIVNYP